jgi:hypothetical protein
MSLWAGGLLLDNEWWRRRRKGREKVGSRYVGNLGAGAIAVVEADAILTGGGGGGATSFSIKDNMLTA